MNIQPAEVADNLLLSSQDEQGVLRLTMNNPGSRNALSDELMAALQNAIDQANKDATIRVIILAANGPAFSAGHDIKQITARRKDSDEGRAYFQELLASCSKLMTSVVTCPTPIIAEISGIAAAAGLQLAASCDLVIAAQGSQFCTPGVNIGLFCSTPMVALSRAVSRKHAMEMLLTGDMMDVETAHRFGLVNRVVPAGELVATTSALARQIASKSAAVVAIGKEAFYRQAELGLEDAYKYCSETMVTNLMLRDSEEGLGAFIEKRKPNWQDR